MLMVAASLNNFAFHIVEWKAWTGVRYILYTQFFRWQLESLYRVFYSFPYACLFSFPAISLCMQTFDGLNSWQRYPQPAIVNNKIIKLNKVMKIPQSSTIFYLSYFKSLLSLLRLTLFLGNVSLYIGKSGKGFHLKFKRISKNMGGVFFLIMSFVPKNLLPQGMIVCNISGEIPTWWTKDSFN